MKPSLSLSQFLRSKTALGILIILSAFFLRAFEKVVLKGLRVDLPSGQLTCLRFFIGVVTLFLFSSARGQYGVLIPKGSFRLHCWRTGLGIVAALTSIFTIKFLSLADHTAIGYLNPILLTIFARIFLQEKVPPLRWCAVACGVVGVSLVSVTPLLSVSVALIVFLVGRVMAAASDICIRLLRTAGENADTIVGFYFFCGAFALSPLAYIQWQHPSVYEWIGIIFFSTAGIIFQMLYTHAFGLLGASMIGPFSYTTLVWAFFFDAILWDSLPSLLGIVGSLLVITDAVFAIASIYQEHHTENQKGI